MKLPSFFGAASESVVTKNMNRFIDSANWGKAAEQCAKLVRHFHPENINLRVKLAELYMKAGAKDKALIEYQEAGERFQEQEDCVKAISIFRTIINIDPRLPNIRVKLAELFVAQGEMEEAWKQAIEGLRYLESKRLTDQVANTLTQLSRLAFDSIKLFKIAEMLRIRSQMEKAKNLFLNTAEKSLQEKCPKVAAQAFKRVLLIEPENVEAKKGLELVQCLLAAQEREEEEKRVARSLEREAIYPYSELWQNFSEERLDEILAEIALYEEENSRENLREHFDKGLAYMEMNLLDAAVAEFQKASRDPDITGDCYKMLTACYKEKGLERLASEYREKLAQIA